MEFYFTLTSENKLKEISTPVTVAHCDKLCRSEHNCNAIWDTGATSSMITRRIAQKLNLHSIGKVRIAGVHGAVNTNIYTVDIRFGNGFTIPNVTVSEADDGGGFDVLIGMDIINQGRLLIDGSGAGVSVFFAYNKGDCTDKITMTRIVSRP